MSYPTKSYTAYVKRLCALIGIPQDGLTPDEQNFLQEYFQTNFDEAWMRTNWAEICPIGEARLVGNLVEYANNYTNPNSSWLTNNTTVADNAFANPADARITAGLLSENLATNFHYLQSSTPVPVVPNTNYQFSVYVRPSSVRTGIYLTCGSGHDSYFTLTGNGIVGTQSGCTASCNLTANGFYLCTLSFTTNATETQVVSELDLWNGTSLSYTGTGAFVYIWGWYVGTGSNSPQNQLIPWQQTGENVIDSVFTAWKDNPSYTSYPRPQGYQTTGDGLMIVGVGGTGYTYGWGVTPNTAFSGAVLPNNLVYLNYRPRSPDFSAAAWDQTVIYTSGESILFTDSTGTQNFFECIVPTTAAQGNSPDVQPSYWEIIPIPEIFFKYIVYGSYADWLRQDGQTDKADNADETAEGQLASEFDRQERQMQNYMPLRVSTHVTSQPRY